MKRIVIVGATSGIGYHVAKQFIGLGNYMVGVAGRRESQLKELQALAPDRVQYQTIDVTADDAPSNLHALIEKLGGMDIYFHSSGIGRRNPELDPQTEISTAETNAIGAVRMLDTAFHYFTEHNGGQLVAISSVAGTRGIGVTPAYSASKAFLSTYLSALSQLGHSLGIKLHVTDIRPGFVRTPILREDVHYPMLIEPETAAKQILRAVEHRRRVKYIDWRYAIFATFLKMLTNRTWERIKLNLKEE